MSIQRCPKCGSPRVQRGFDDPPLILRLFFVYDLLCNNCDHEFRGFALHGAAQRARRMTKVDLSAATGHVQARLRRTPSDERRGKPRASAMTPVKLKLYGNHEGANDAAGSPVLSGHTRDLSEQGVALVIPESRFNDTFLAQHYRRLVITLELPGRKAVRVQAVAMHYELIVEGEFERGFLIGAKMTKMSTEDRFIYLDFLNTLSSAEEMDFDELALLG